MRDGRASRARDAIDKQPPRAATRLAEEARFRHDVTHVSAYVACARALREYRSYRRRLATFRPREPYLLRHCRYFSHFSAPAVAPAHFY